MTQQEHDEEVIKLVNAWWNDRNEFLSNQADRVNFKIHVENIVKISISFVNSENTKSGEWILIK